MRNFLSATLIYILIFIQPKEFIHGGPLCHFQSRTSHFSLFSSMFNLEAISNLMEDTDEDFSVEILPMVPSVSPFSPANSTGIFVKDFPVDPGPLIHATFMSRRNYASRGEPIPFPIGSQAMAELTPLPCTSSRIPDEDRPHSPATINNSDIIFDSDRDYLVGFSDPPESQRALRTTLAALPNVRSVWLLLNVIGLNLDRPEAMSSGFLSGIEIQESSIINSIASYSMARTFSSRLEVDLYLRDAAFSVQVEVTSFQWVLVAPLFICRIIQDWSVMHNTSPAIIRSHPDLGTAFEEISSSLDLQGRLAFLSPLRYSALGPLQSTNLNNGTFQFPDLPHDLPSSRSQGCFRPTSMLILNFPYSESLDSARRGFTVLSTDWGNSPVRVDRCFGYSEMVTIVSRSHGNALVIPFLEGPSALQCPLTFSLIQWLPYFCWPVPSQDTCEIAQAISSSFIPPAFVGRNHSSQISLGSEGSD